MSRKKSPLPLKRKISKKKRVQEKENLKSLDTHYCNSLPPFASNVRGQLLCITSAVNY
jgi:hypothetical protein